MTVLTSSVRALIGSAVLLEVVGAGIPAGAVQVTVPPPQLDARLAATSGEATAVLAGGCFWGVQAVFEHVRGVRRVVAGYAGGTAASARSELVEAGGTRHAESVEVVYDPAVITYGRLLQVFFAIAHDPTQLNRQGPDEGPQYRS